MALGNTPAIFVSSTFYDLKQHRLDLKGFIEALGYEAILSEFDTFPTNPDAGTVDNCLQVVDENADILVLVVGGRYGSVVDQTRSVTNMEFARARAKGIPVYIYVEKKILDMIPIGEVTRISIGRLRWTLQSCSSSWTRYWVLMEKAFGSRRSTTRRTSLRL